MASLGQLTLDLVARVGGFTGPLGNAAAAANREMASVKKAFKGAATAATVTAGAMTAASTAVITLTKKAADNAREIRNQAEVANASAAEFQKMAFGANTVGIEQEKLSDILKDVNDRIGDFNENKAGPMVDFFDNVAPKVGVTADMFARLSGPEALQLYFDSLEKANLSQAELTFYMEAIAGDATKLIPLLRNSGEGFKTMAEEAEELGIILSDLDIAKLEAFAREFDRIHAILSTTVNIIGAELSPYLTTLGNDLVELASEGEGFGVAIRGAVNGSLVSLGYLGNALHATEVALKGVRALAFSIGQAYTTIFAEIINALGWMADQIAGTFNFIIKGINLIPDTDDIPLIASFQHGGYANGVRAARDEMAKLGEEARKSLMDAAAEPWPSERINEWLQRVKEAADAIEVTPKVKVDVETPEQTDRTPPAGSGSSGRRTGAATDMAEANKAAAAIERQRTAYQALLDELYPLQALQDDFFSDMALLNLANAAGEVDDYADAVQRLKNMSAESAISAYESSTGNAGEAPSYGGLDAEVGGLFGELTKIDQQRETLDEWYSEQLEMLEEFREQRAELNEQWDEKEAEIKKDYNEKVAELEQARQTVALKAGEDTAAALADIAKTSAGEQSAVYKAMFIAQKAFAIAQSVIAIQQGIAMAAANPFPYNLAAMASVAAATASIVSNIASVAAPDGMAHDGIDSVPQDGTWLLQKGERVTTASTSAKLDKTLDNVQKGGSGSGVTVNLIEDASKAGQVEQGTEGEEDTVNIWVANLMADGKAHKALTSKYGLKTKGT